MQDEIAKSAYEYQRQIESLEKIIVGVNQFQVEQESPIPSFKIDDNIRQVQTDKLNAIKQKRDNSKAQFCLQQVNAAAKNQTNLMPVVIEAVENHCTLGEIADQLRSVFGEYK